MASDWIKKQYEKAGIDFEESERGFGGNNNVHLYTCPRCGYAINATADSRPRCRGCDATVIIQNGRVKGWQ